MKPLKVLSKFENYFLIRTVSFQVHLEAGGYFLLRRFLRLHLQQAGIQHKNTLVPHLNGRWISKFLGEKFVFEKSALIRSILHQTGTITSGFEGKKRKYHFLKNRAILWYALSRAVHKNRTSQVRFSPSKPDLSGPKNFFESVISYQQDTNWTLKTEWPSAWDTRRRPRKGEPENAAGKGQEIHAERTA